MRIGKLQESILIRSVFKNIKHTKKEVLQAPAVGMDGSVLDLLGGQAAITTNTVPAGIAHAGAYGVQLAANNLAVLGSTPIGVMVTVFLPKRTREIQLKNIMQEIESTCEALEMEVLGGHTQITEAVTKPLLSITGIGRKDQKKKEDIKGEMDVVMTKWIGLEASAILAEEKEEALLEKLPRQLIETAKEFRHLQSVLPESECAWKYGISAIKDVNEGGIFGALWELSHREKAGLEVDLRSIPVRQETIEICEYFGLNPYEIKSGGAAIIFTTDGNGLVSALREEKIEATIIGRTTNSNDKIIKNGEEIRHLDKPQMDSLYEILES